ncbi:pyridoxamine 5'-phosphate oxidase family protein [Asanoa sp. NPDC050611]|uniref:pyridoxamine 5'-phosphate oxidase family protein n=1 Tax=Asanoa sp. NPDC050611 TaxID=3157098 RepID=UPI0033DA405C
MRPTSEHIDPQYSEAQAAAVPWTDAEARLAAAEVAWIVTVRPDGRPHATPMVPVVHDGKVYFHTGDREVKYANLQANPRVLVLAGDTAWDQGLDVAVDGTATPVTDAALLRRLADLYRERWDGRWEIDVTPDARTVVFEVTPDKVYGHAKGEPFGQTNYRFTQQ